MKRQRRDKRLNILTLYHYNYDNVLVEQCFIAFASREFYDYDI